MALILGAIGTALAQQQPTTPKIFTVCLGSFVEVDQNDFDDVKSLGFVYSESFSKHLTQVYLGEYAKESAAQEILTAVQGNGFPDAYVSQRKLSDEDLVEVIQLGVEILSEKIHWQQYAAAQPISILLDDQQVRIVTGPYPSKEATQKKIKALKNLGFANLKHPNFFYRSQNLISRQRLNPPQHQPLCQSPIFRML